MKKTSHLCHFLLLALLVSASAMTACADKEDNNDALSNSSETMTASNESTDDNALKDNLPELDYGDETVSILHFGLEQMAGHDSSDWYGNSGDVIASALYTRDLVTEERLHVKLAYTAGSDDWGTYPNNVSKMIASGDCPYDMIFLESSQCFREIL